MKSKRSLFLAALLAVCLLCACAGETERVLPAEPTGLELRSIPWNSGPGEVCEALGLEMDALEREEDNNSFTLIAEGLELFGASDVQARFRFSNFSLEDGGYFGLDYVHVVFPESAGKDAVFAALTEVYGPEDQEYVQHSPIDGSLQALAKEEGVSCWFSDVKLGDVLSEQERLTFREMYLPGLSDEDLADFMAAEPVAVAVWTEDHYGQLEATMGDDPALQAAIEQYGRVATLDINGEHMVRILQLF